MMKKLLFIVVIFTSCQKSPFDFMVEEGPVIVETRQLAPFDTLHINDILDVTLVPDTACFIEISSGKNIIPYILSDVQSGILTLDNTIKGRWARPYHHPKISLHVQDLSSIVLNEACNLTSSDSINCGNLYMLVNSELASIDMVLKGNYFDLALRYTCSGHCSFKGYLNRAKFFSGGTTELDASLLSVNSAVLFQNSVSDMQVWVTKEITDLRNFKGGNVFVKGQPSIVHYHEKKDSVNVFFLEK